ncbi:MAG: c-type cytochrome [Hyphomicrobiales bacterium]|nr:c-type cytochrome [Hyphomicrobiales bacterium]
MPDRAAPAMWRLLTIMCVVAVPVLGFAAASVSGGRVDLREADKKRVDAATRPATDFSKPEKFEAMQGGAGTRIDSAGTNAFAYPSANLSFSDRERFNLGRALFTKLWVSAPASTTASDGLGPLFNARACSSCHIGNGRGRAPDGNGNHGSLILGLSAAVGADGQAPLPDPTYGNQLQTRAIQGHSVEGRFETVYVEFDVRLDDGTGIRLRRPTYLIKDLCFGPVDAGTVILPRMAPPMHGLGLIEQIADSDLAALADPDDRDGDGISGRLIQVSDPKTGEPAVGRYGWKASRHSIHAQSAAAFSDDIGLSTSVFPGHAGDCRWYQADCRAAPHGAQPRHGNTEVPDHVLDLVTDFAAQIAVPARRDVADRQVLRGKELFYGAGCTSCHQPKFVTRRNRSGGSNAFQLIWPYSDFLLHDMGDGLADAGERDLAREWRTPPLWGIGLTGAVLRESNFLHDGRARTLEEAVLWHGGEAVASRDTFDAMRKSDRDALMRFLNSL